MKPETLYRILSYVLVIIAAIMGLAAVAGLFLALANPFLLLSLFILVAVVLYSFSSFLFLTNGIDSKLPLRRRMIDFIKVNAYMAIVFAVMNLFQAGSLLWNPAGIETVADQLIKLQPPNSPLGKELIIRLFKAVLLCMTVYSLLLLVHIQLTFYLLRKYASVFSRD